MGSNEKVVSSEKLKGKQINVNRLQEHYMKLLEEQNKERVTRLRITRRNNLWTAAGLGCAVFGIYVYTMCSVKQERFLDDFEEPQKVTQ